MSRGRGAADSSLLFLDPRAKTKFAFCFGCSRKKLCLFRRGGKNGVLFADMSVRDRYLDTISNRED